MTKALAKAVLAGRLYEGSIDCPISAAQRLYNRYRNACKAIATKTGMEIADVMTQVGAEARRQGAIRPTPGKDY